jgi:DNA polymerase-3 subunit gamma/tau
VAVVQAVPSVLDNTPEDRQRMEHLASSLTAEDIQLFYQVGLHAQRDMEFAPDLRSGFEMALLRMIAFKPEGVLDSTATSTKKKTELTPSASAAIAIATPEKIPVVAVSAIAVPNVIISEVMTSEVMAPKVIAPEVMTSKVITPVVTNQKPDTTSATPQQSLTTQNWPAIWQLLPLAGVIRNTASHCSLEQIENKQLYFTLNEHHAGLYDPSHAQRLNDALNAFLSNSYTVHIKTGLPTTATPHQVQHQKRAEQQQLAEMAFRQDETVMTLIKHFDGTIVEGSISPLPKVLH